MRFVTSLVLAAVSSVALSCATEQVRWGDETPDARDDAAPTTARAAEDDKKLTAADYAARFPTDGGCEAEARRIDGKKRELALKLLGACIDRGDFKRIGALVDAPWTPELRRNPDARLWCARIVAARAGDVEADVKACNAIGLGTWTLEQLFTDPGKAKGAWVIFRARLDAEHPSKRDTRLVETAVEDGEPETGVTGRRISAAMGGRKATSHDAIFLARGVRVGEDATADDGEPVAFVEVQAMFTAADSPTYN